MHLLKWPKLNNSHWHLSELGCDLPSHSKMPMAKQSFSKKIGIYQFLSFAKCNFSDWSCSFSCLPLCKTAAEFLSLEQAAWAANCWKIWWVLQFDSFLSANLFPTKFGQSWELASSGTFMSAYSNRNCYKRFDKKHSLLNAGLHGIQKHWRDWHGHNRSVESQQTVSFSTEGHWQTQSRCSSWIYQRQNSWSKCYTVSFRYSQLARCRANMLWHLKQISEEDATLTFHFPVPS